ncbi:MAG: hypothetical protein CVU44_21090 [Chloroflexi bacterium HGW-Chloroflexi-6]|nr:MAG: hypothetical protein CVU44_21090 [Chloroflexi bacterium HGW-Chloroflexi-6]
MEKIIDESKALEKKIDDFLQSNPGAKKALDIFGIADERYRAALQSKNSVRFYTTNTTSPQK